MVRSEKNKEEQCLGGSLRSQNNLKSKVEKLKRFLCAACPFFKENFIIIVEIVFAGSQPAHYAYWAQQASDKLYSVIYTTYLEIQSKKSQLH